MTARYDVDPEQLRAHAGRLAAHAGELSAIGSRLPAEPGAQSLGTFAQFITAGLGAAMGKTTDAFAHTASTLDKVSEGMRLAAERYQRSDEDHAARLSALDPGEGGR